MNCNGDPKSGNSVPKRIVLQEYQYLVDQYPTFYGITPFDS